MKTLFSLAVLLLTISTSISAQQTTPLWLRDVQISPDGTQVLFCYKGDIYKVSSSGGDATRLTSQSSYECYPIWSPDGREVAFASDRHGNFDLFIMSAGGGNARRLTYNSASEIPQSFSPDGKYVYFGAAIQDPAESVMFPTSSLGELYKVSAKGGRTMQVIASPAEMISFMPGTESFCYQDKKGYEDEWRKHHTSSITRDIWFYDAKTGKHTNLTKHAGEDRNPIIAKDSKQVFFLSERNKGSMNVYSAPLLTDREGSADKLTAITSFKTHPVRFLSIGAGTLCYTYDGEIYTQKIGGKPSKLSIKLTRDDEKTYDNLSLSSGARQACVSKSGKEVAFIVRGDVFVTSTEYATTKQITKTAGAESGISFAPDGRSIAYASERDGNWQLYIARIKRDEDPNFSNATVIEEEIIIPDKSIERAWPKYSPDGKKIAFIEDRTKLKVVDLATKKITQVTDGSTCYSYGGSFDFEWSPDNEWFVIDYVSNRRYPYSDQGIVSVNGGEIHPITQSGYMSGNAKWVMDGKAILFESDRYGMRSHASWGSQNDVFLAFLTQDAYDRYRLSPEDYALQKELDDRNKKNKAKDKDKDSKDKKDSKSDKDDKEEGKDKDKDKKKETPKLEIDFAGIENRIVRLTPNSSDLGDAIISKDGENLYYYASFEGGPDLWKLNLRKKETKLVSKNGGGSLQMDSIGNLYALGRSMKKIEKGNDNAKPITFSGTMKIDLAAEREYMYHHMAKQIEKKIFRKDYNGCDWPMMVRHYEKFLPHIDNNYDFAELLSEILGELNVSHSGGRYRHTMANSDATATLGLLYDYSHRGEGMKISAVLEGGPFDRATSKVKAGDIITAINGQELTKDTDIAELMNKLSGKKTLVSLSGAQGQWEEVVLPISSARQNALLYKRWVKSRAAEVERLSNGRLGYVHIESMDDESFRNVYSDILGKYNLKEGIVIDTRYNGGGRLHEDIEILFSGEKYFTQVIRGREACDMPSRRYNHPSIMLQAEGNYSNAHGTPWVYSHKKMGKLVGAPVPGTMSSVNWETLQDPSLVFGAPVVGYQLPDGTYLENTQLEPDVLILNRPETVVKGTDLQLEAAVKELLKDIDSRK